MADGRAFAWGTNDDGELGNNSFVNSSTPVQVVNLSNVVGVAAGYYHSMGLLADGTVRCWGYNGRGQLGNNSYVSSSVPVTTSGTNVTNVTAVAAGSGFSLALKADGTVWGWGNNIYNQLGSSTFGSNSAIAVKIPGLSNVVAIDARLYHSVALSSNGTVWTWGDNYYGQLGQGHFNPVSNVVQVASLSNVVQVAGGSYGGGALQADGKTMEWGVSGSTGSGGPAWADRAPALAKLAEGDLFALGVTREGSVFSWGYNQSGQLGNGTFSLTLLDESPSYGFSPFPYPVSGRIARGNLNYPDYTSFVIPLNQQKGVRLDTTGTDSYKYPTSTPWFTRLQKQTRLHVGEVTTGTQVSRFPVENPIAAFGSELGGTPLYPNLSYGFGAYAGGLNEALGAATNAFKILVFDRSQFTGGTNNIGPIFTTNLVVPRRTADAVAWGNFVTNGFAATVDVYGLRTMLEFVDGTAGDKPWGLTWFFDGNTNVTMTNFTLAAYKLTHVAGDTATNYHFVIEGLGAVQTGSNTVNYFATNSSGTWVTVPLYSLDFESRRPARSFFVDQPQFEGQPLPPAYAGKSVSELKGLTAVITNTIWLTNNAAYLNLDNSPELRQHPTLDQLVKDLKNDPLKLASFVINEIELADPIAPRQVYNGNPYPNYQSLDMGGVNRSALGTFLERQGSPTEQCALLVYLLRKAGYAAAYVWPTNQNLKLLDSEVSRLLGMQVRGAPSTFGQPFLMSTLIPVNYPWVVVNLGTNKSIQVFPWLKDTEIVEGLNLYDYLPTNYNNAYKWVKDYVLAKSSILSLDPDNNIPASLFPKFVQQYLTTNAPGISLDDLGVRVTNRRREFARWEDLPLPNWLENQNQTVVVDNLSASQPFLTNVFNTFQIQVFSGTTATGTPVIDSGSLRMTDLNDRKFLLLTNNPSTLELWLAGYRPGTTNVSAFNDTTLTNVEVKTYSVGTQTVFTVQLIHRRHRAAMSDWDGFLSAVESLALTNARPYQVADLAGIAINLGRVTQPMLRQHTDAYVQLERQKATNSSYLPPVEDYQGTVAYLLGLGYYEREARFLPLLAGLHKVHVISRFDAGLSKLTAWTQGGTRKTQGGVDMPHGIVVVTPFDNLRADLGENEFTSWQNYFWLWSAFGSAEEHNVINTTLESNSAISTVRLLQLAQLRATNGNVGVLELTSKNYASIGTNAQSGWGTNMLKNQDAQIWAAVTNAFAGWDGDYVRVLITPGKVTNEVSSYVGMGALIMWKGAFGTLIGGNYAPTSGGEGSLVPDLTPVTGSYQLPYSQILSPGGDVTYHYNSVDVAASRATFTPTDTLLLDSDSQNSAPPSVVSAAAQAGNLLNVSGFAQIEQATENTGNQGPPGFWKSLGTTMADPVNVITGEFYIDHTDLVLPGPLPLQIRRNYQSQNLADNQFGYGWKLSLMPFLTLTTNASGVVLLYGAEMDGSVIAYRKQTNDVYLVDARDNPLLNNNTTAGIGSTANWFNARIDRYTNASQIYYRLKGPDGSQRIFRERSDFLLSAGGSSLARIRPYLDTWQDNRGNTLTFYFGTNSLATDYGQVNRVESSNGGFLGFIYDAYGRIIEAFAGDGRRLNYEFDRFGDLVKVTLPDQSELNYEYQHNYYNFTNGGVVTTNLDSNHLLVVEDKPDGRRLQNVYDAQRRVTQQQATVGADLRFYTNATFIYSNTADISNSVATTYTGQTVVKDFFNNPTTNFYGGSLITNITDALGQKILQDWYPTNATPPGVARGLKRRIDKRGLITDYLYDGSGNVTNLSLSVTNAGGDLTGTGVTNATFTASYNTNNLILETVDPWTNKVQYVYSTNYLFLPERISRLAGSTAVSSNVLTYQNVTNVVSDGVQSVTNRAYGLLQQEVRAAGSSDAATNQWTYDGRGFITQQVRITGTTDSNVVVNFVYNDRGEPIEQSDAAARKTKFDYDALGRPKYKEVYEAGQSVPLAWEYSYYNANGELVWSDGPRFDPEDYVWRDYDGAGRQTQEIRWRSRARLDGTGVEAESGDALYATTFYEFDGFGNLKRSIDPRGVVTTNTWDALGRLLTRTVLETNGTTLTTESLAYNAAGDVTFHTNALGGVTEKRYTSTGKPTYQKTPDGSTNAWTYYVDGRLRREYQGNGAYWETTYDDANRRGNKKFYAANNTLLATNLTEMDQRGNVVRRVDAAGNAFTNRFDGLDRVKSTAGPVVKYDPPPGVPVIPEAIPPPVQQASTNYFDAAGVVTTNLNALGEKSITYRDALSRVTRAEVRDSANTLVRQSAMVYSADHQGVTTTSGSGTTAIVTTTFTDNDGHNVLALAYPSSGVREFTLRQFDVTGNATYEARFAATNSAVSLFSSVASAYDGLHRVTQRTDRDNALTTFSYDALGDLTNRVMPGSLKWQATYNNAGQLLKDYNLGSGGAGARTNTYTYFTSSSAFAGKLQTRTDGRSVVCTYSYDDWLRTLTNAHTGSLAEHNLTTTWRYDVRGLVTNVTESFATTNPGPATVIEQTFDAYGQLKGQWLMLGGIALESAAQDWNAAGRRRSLGLGVFGYQYTWRADGLLASATGLTGGGTYTYDTAGQLLTRAVGARGITVTSRDGAGRVLGLGNTIFGSSLQTETLSYTGDGLIAAHTVNNTNFNDSRSYLYANLSRRLIDERQNLDATKRWTNTFTYDAGTAAGPGVLTKAGATSASWTGGADTFSRISTETNTLTRRQVWGTNNGPASIALSLDGQPQTVTMLGTQQMAWRAMIEVGSTGAHQLKVAATHPSGQYTAYGTNWFTNNVASQSASVNYDAAGNVTSRTWTQGTNGPRTQTFAWDAKGRLNKVTERDSTSSGYDWGAAYDPFGRRLSTTSIAITNGVTNAASPVTISQYYDPQVEFLELGTTVSSGAGVPIGCSQTVWKLYGPDLNGAYGGLNGVGGFEAIIPGPELFCPVFSDARGNVLAVYDGQHGGLVWNASRVTGYGSVPGYKPLPLGHGADIVAASAWRDRWSDVTGLANLGARYYDMVAGRMLSFDPVNDSMNASGYTLAGGEPIVGFDPTGRFGKQAAHDALAVGGWASDTALNALNGTAAGVNWVAGVGAELTQPVLGISPEPFYSSMREWQSHLSPYAKAGYYNDQSPVAQAASGTTILIAPGSFAGRVGTAERMLANEVAAEGTAFRAINPAYAESTAQSGFFRSGAAGRLGNDGIYANSTVEGAIAEFKFHNPGVDPAVFRVQYPLSPTLNISPPSGYFNQPLPFTQGANILTAPSLRAPGTANMLIREGAIPAGRIQ